MLKNHIEIEYLVDSYKKTLSGKNANTRGSSFHSSRLRIVIFPLRVFFTVLLKDYFSVIFYLFHLGRKKGWLWKKRNGKGIVRGRIFHEFAKWLFLWDFLSISLLGKGLYEITVWKSFQHLEKQKRYLNQLN